jgi:hypothetical protein
LADLQIDNQNQKKKPKTLKILPWGQKWGMESYFVYFSR